MIELDKTPAPENGQENTPQTQEKPQNPQEENKEFSTEELLKELGIKPEDMPDIEELLKEPKQEPQQNQRKYADVFNTVDDLEKSYKELLSTHTKVEQRFKPFEPLINLMEQDTDFGNFVIKAAERKIKGEPLVETPKAPTRKEDELDFLEEKNDIGKVPEDIVREAVAKAVEQSKAETIKTIQAVATVSSFKAAHPDITDQELAKVLVIANKAGIDMESAYRAALPEKYELELKQKLIKEKPNAPSVSNSAERNVSNNSTSLLKAIFEDPSIIDKLPKAQREAVLNELAILALTT